MSRTVVAESGRLVLRFITPEDGPFLFRLMTDPTWIEHIGDRGLREAKDAVRYIEDRLAPMYATLGYGLYLVELRSTGESIGICGPLKRGGLPEPDLGFALLPAYAGKGYAAEAAVRSLELCRDQLGIRRILAICKPGNSRSIRLLEKVGFRFERKAPVPPLPGEQCLYACDLAPIRPQ